MARQGEVVQRERDRKDKKGKASRDIKFAEHPFCHWCGVKLIHPRDVTTKTHPDNMATLDHLRSKFDPKRPNRKPGEQRWFLSCKKCNMERGRADEKAQPIEELRRRAGGHGDSQRHGLDWTEVKRGRFTPIQWPPKVQEP